MCYSPNVFFISPWLHFQQGPTCGCILLPVSTSGFEAATQSVLQDRCSMSIDILGRAAGAAVGPGFASLTLVKCSPPIKSITSSVMLNCVV